jgi:hypothetical protein
MQHRNHDHSKQDCCCAIAPHSYSLRRDPGIFHLRHDLMHRESKKFAKWIPALIPHERNALFVSIGKTSHSQCRTWSGTRDAYRTALIMSTFHPFPSRRDLARKLTELNFLDLKIMDNILIPISGQYLSQIPTRTRIVLAIWMFLVLDWDGPDTYPLKPPAHWARLYTVSRCSLLHQLLRVRLDSLGRLHPITEFNTSQGRVWIWRKSSDGRLQNVWTGVMIELTQIRSVVVLKVLARSLMKEPKHQ